MWRDKADVHTAKIFQAWKFYHMCSLGQGSSSCSHPVRYLSFPKTSCSKGYSLTYHMVARKPCCWAEDNWSTRYLPVILVGVNLNKQEANIYSNPPGPLFCSQLLTSSSRELMKCCACLPSLWSLADQNFCITSRSVIPQWHSVQWHSSTTETSSFIGRNIKALSSPTQDLWLSTFHTMLPWTPGRCCFCIFSACCD